MTKKYRALNSLHLITTFIVNGIEAVVEFKGGRVYPHRENGIFITSNKLLQEVLEGCEDYGKSFILDNQECNKEADISKNNDIKKKHLASKNKKPEPIDYVKSKQVALEWLRDEKGVVLSRKSSANTIEAHANRLGYTFINLTTDK